MTDEMINNMTPNEIKEYLEEVEADMILGSIDYQERDYVDCYLPA